MKTTPLVSIGMPVYNGMPYIKKALKTLCAQTFDDFVIFISDNNSNDGTSEYLMKEAQNNSKIVYYKQKTTIPATDNFLYVLNNCKSKYFMFAAHDDKWEPTFIEKLLPFLEKDTSVNCVFSASKIENYIQQTITKSSFVNIKTTNSIYENSYLYINSMRPHIIYGLFKYSFIQEYLNKTNMQFDWSDCIFGYYICLSGKVHFIDEYLYTAGIVEAERIPKTYGKKRKYFNFTYRYKPFMINGWKEIGFSKKLSFNQKVRLIIKHTFAVINNFIHQEKNHCSNTKSIQIMTYSLSWLKKFLGKSITFFQVKKEISDDRNKQ